MFRLLPLLLLLAYLCSAQAQVLSVNLLSMEGSGSLSSLSPPFHRGLSSYSAACDSTITKFALVLTHANGTGNASVIINARQVQYLQSGQVSFSAATLPGNENIIEIRWLSYADDSLTVYTIVMNRITATLANGAFVSALSLYASGGGDVALSTTFSSALYEYQLFCTSTLTRLNVLARFNAGNVKIMLNGVFTTNLVSGVNSSSVLLPSSGPFTVSVVHVSSPDSLLSSTYTLYGRRLTDTKLNLVGFTINPAGKGFAAITTPYAPAQFTYSYIASNTVSRVSLTAFVASSYRSLHVKFNDQPYQQVAPKLASQQYELTDQVNVLYLRFQAGILSPIRTYMIVISRFDPAEGALITRISLSGVPTGQLDLTSRFNPAQTSYTVYVPYAHSSGTFSASFTTGGSATLSMNDASASALTNGQPSQVFDLDIGSNFFVLAFTNAESAGVTTPYVFELVRLGRWAGSVLSSIDLLSNSTNDIQLYPPFQPYRFNYQIIVAPGTRDISISASFTSGSASASLNGDEPSILSSAVPSSSLALQYGASNTIQLSYINDQDLTRLYTIVIVRLPINFGSACFLELLSSPSQSLLLSTPFSPLNSLYTATVPYSLTSLRVRALFKQGSATLAFNGVQAGGVTKGVPTQSQDLDVGDNLIQLAYTNSNSVIRTYTVIVRRLAFSDPSTLMQVSLNSVGAGFISQSTPFTPTTFSYTVVVGRGITEIGITAGFIKGVATLQINDQPQQTLFNQIASQTQSLNIGGSNTIILMYTNDAGTTLIYTWKIIRVALPTHTGLNFLSSLSVVPISSAGQQLRFSSSFNPFVHSYAAVADWNVTAVQMLAQFVGGNCSVTCNNQSSQVSTGQASNSIALQTGNNQIQIECYFNARRILYEYSINKLANDVNLRSRIRSVNLIGLNSGDIVLSSPFDSSMTSYTGFATSTVASIVVAIEFPLGTSTVQINSNTPVALCSQCASPVYQLSSGINTITIKYISTSAVQTVYSFVINRWSSNTLSNGFIDSINFRKNGAGQISFSQSFDPTVINYDVIAEQSVDSFDFASAFTGSLIYSFQYPPIGDADPIVLPNVTLVTGQRITTQIINVGMNIIRLFHTDLNGVETLYTFALKKLSSSVGSILSNIKFNPIGVGSISVSSSFRYDVVDYTYTVEGMSSASLTFEYVESEGSVSVGNGQNNAIADANAANWPAYTPTQISLLRVGSSAFRIRHTPLVGTPRLYTLTIIRVASTNTRQLLSSLNVFASPLSASLSSLAFSSGITRYTVTASKQTTYINFKAVFCATCASLTMLPVNEGDSNIILKTNVYSRGFILTNNQVNVFRFVYTDDAQISTEYIINVIPEYVAVQPLSVKLRLMSDFESLWGTVDKRQSFQVGFARDLSLSLGIAASRVSVSSVAAGSAIVDLTIAAPTNEGEPTRQQAIEQLIQQASNTSSDLYSPDRTYTLSVDSSASLVTTSQCKDGSIVTAPATCPVITALNQPQTSSATSILFTISHSHVALIITCMAAIFTIIYHI